MINLQELMTNQRKNLQPRKKMKKTVKYVKMVKKKI